MENEQIKDLADKIASSIMNGSAAPDLASLSRSIEALSERIERLENAAKAQPAPAELHTDHPSRDRFQIAEAIVDRLFETNTNEKACTFEPNGKPCDHCSMCSSRGF